MLQINGKTARMNFKVLFNLYFSIPKDSNAVGEGSLIEGKEVNRTKCVFSFRTVDLYVTYNNVTNRYGLALLF